mmetsp:Transcript_9128/g.22993  ORF Transcript_9128/g.22993 Transcript_9128/m.22993 type:complete len:235 (+) Transcript_9128:1025-1729(+)
MVAGSQSRPADTCMQLIQQYTSPAAQGVTSSSSTRRRLGEQPAALAAPPAASAAAAAARYSPKLRLPSGSRASFGGRNMRPNQARPWPARPPSGSSTSWPGECGAAPPPSRIQRSMPSPFITSSAPAGTSGATISPLASSSSRPPPADAPAPAAASGPDRPTYSAGVITMNSPMSLCSSTVELSGAAAGSSRWKRWKCSRDSARRTASTNESPEPGGTGPKRGAPCSRRSSRRA